MKKIISSLLITVLLLSAAVIPSVCVSAAGVSIDYSFSKPDKGFAEGTISLTAEDGSYWLYWSDGNKALDGYREIAHLTFDKSETQEHKMYERAAIPVEAEKLIAIKSESAPADKTVKNASAVFDIPESKRFDYKLSDKKYRFASYSDVHVDSSKKSYKYDEIHWRKALDTAAARDVDFMVLSGDYVNNTTGYQGISVSEWKTYQRVLSESDYCNPIYEAIGNHEVRQDPVSGTLEFIKGTGLEGSDGKSPYGYFAKDICGDHFIFMSMEKGFNPTRKVDQFSENQMKWVEGLLEKYSGDGHNIYILEHALFYKYGAGDRVDDEPYYKLPLYDTLDSTQWLKSLLQKYRDVIFITGHTHISFSEQYNYSDNGNTSAQMIHNSSIGGVRHIVDGALKSNYKKDEAEGYIVDVFDDAIYFNGANVYYNEIDPNWCYIVKPSKNFANVTKEYAAQPEKQTISNDDIIKIGNVNLDSFVNITDASIIQRYLAGYEALNPLQLINGDANLDGKVSIKDSTRIQKYIAKLIASMYSQQAAAKRKSNIKKNVQSNLSLYYRYASYDCYQALKKAYRSNADNKTLELLNAKLLYVVNADNVDKEESRTIYYEDNKGWDKVYAYIWNKADNKPMVEMPGTEMTYVTKNSDGHSIYKFTIPDKYYDMFRFTNGTDVTETIRFYSGDVCYYIYSDTSKLKLKCYKFTES